MQNLHQMSKQALYIPTFPSFEAYVEFLITYILLHMCLLQQTQEHSCIRSIEAWKGGYVWKDT